MAKAITKTFRDASYAVAQQSAPNASLADVEKAAGAVAGQASTSTNFVRVHWYWISLPALVWGLAASIWLSTAIVTRKVGVPRWQNNPLPLLFLYTGGEKAQDQQETPADTADRKGIRVSAAACMTRASGIRTRLVIRDNEAELI
ncbi:uncharacterized protein Z520_03261 [Fonsecaea multimorphosa CBS 102226]|uniref:Uncharacterized protein n=1 Tax=Fonsecaea multimorphosa CBS 102226 TaxID=1442371 RepID=A0A0D2K436_9EURO|nr:uncharacterized protein Z520_03261 [Fonsecaea multimorphosa CBS 102226]KIY00598.1 hypothetical protein Z520_03261 [Fonsecaea multimorphosa CBS 102226]